MRKMILLAAGVIATPAIGEPSKEATAFGAREAAESVSLSPDGTRVAIVSSDGGRGSLLRIAPLGMNALPKAITKTTGNPDQLLGCQWSTNTRLTCTIYLIMDGTFGLLPHTRQIAIDADGANPKVLTRESSRSMSITTGGGRVIDWTGDGSGAVLMESYVGTERAIGTESERKSGRAVELVDTDTLKRKIVEPPRIDAFDYITDGEGTVRVMATRERNGDYYSDTSSYFYRRPGSRDWAPLSKTRSNGLGLSIGFDPYAVDRTLNVAYGFDDNGGRQALYKVALDGTLKKDVVVDNGEVDVDALVRLGRTRRVIGASYATDRRAIEFFDPELKKLQASLSKALGGKPLLYFVGADATETKLLLFAGADNDAGSYFLYDKATRKLGEIMPSRPQLAGTKLATVKPVRYPAADGTMIPGYLTLPPGSDGRKVPTIVMPHGGPSARDEWGFDWLSQFFAARGFAVLQPNYRGSSGYGEKFFVKNGFKSWRTAMGDVNDGARWLVREGIADPAKLAIVGWSYGGYAAFQTSVVDPDLFKAIVAIAPVTDLNELKEQYRRFGNATAIGRVIGIGPEAREGSPLQNVGRIKAPVLMFHGDRDLNVEVRQSRLMADALRDAGKKVEYLEYKGLDHQLPDDKVRAEMLDRSDAFLRAAMGM